MMKEETLKKLLVSSIQVLCRQHIGFRDEVHVEGCLSLTVDKNDTFILNVDENVTPISTRPRRLSRKFITDEPTVDKDTSQTPKQKRRGRKKKITGKTASLQDEPDCEKLPSPGKAQKRNVQQPKGPGEVSPKRCEVEHEKTPGPSNTPIEVTCTPATDVAGGPNVEDPGGSDVPVYALTALSVEQPVLKSEPEDLDDSEASGLVLDGQAVDTHETESFSQVDESEQATLSLDAVTSSSLKEENCLSTLSDDEREKDPALIEELIMSKLGPSSDSLWPDEDVWNYVRRPKLYQYDKGFQEACRAVKGGMKYAKAARKFNIPGSKLYYHLTVRERLREERGDDRKSLYTCQHCGRACASKSTLETHERKHTGERPFVCHICDNRFSTKYTLQSHVRRHNADKPFHCPYCDKKFLYRAEMSRHVISHTGLKPFKCSICNKSFGKKSSLMGHQLRHTDERRHKCNQCPEAFISRQSLKRHLAKHSGVREFSCEECQKEFWTKSDLKEHQKLHQNIRQHICPECGLQFARSNSLTSHINWVHNEDRAHVCNTCGKTFKKKHALLKHERNHTGITPYICEVCGKGFKWHTSRKLHMKKHQVKVPESRSQFTFTAPALSEIHLKSVAIEQK